MKASYNWLKDFVDFDLKPSELGHMLTMAGLEVEAAEEVDGDTIYDIGITPNRPDCLSIRGIAREISALLERPLKEKKVQLPVSELPGPSVDIQSSNLCPRYAARIVGGVRMGPSPDWMVKRLESCGIRSMSSIVDVTNYIMLELGQPMHAFDLDTLAGKQIVVKEAGDVKSFSTLDNEERKLSPDMLLIWDAEKPVAVAGVMGGHNSEVSDTTVNVLLESACFNPSSVRMTSRRLNLSTESSYRFERGIDRESVTYALDRAAQLIAEISGGEVSELTDACPSEYSEREIELSVKKVNTIIGIDVEDTFVEKALTNLGFAVSRGGQSLIVIPPSFRNDVERDIDLIEEVARVYGYDNIPSTFPVMQMSPAPVHARQNLIGQIKNAMTAGGFTEAINFSFMHPNVLDALQIPEGDRRRDLLPVKNPLRKEESVMRTSLIPALLNNVKLNLSRGEKNVRLFEISNVFFSSGKQLPDEIGQMAAVLFRSGVASLWEGSHDPFYDVKGALQKLFDSIGAGDVIFQRGADSTEPYLHPGMSCTIGKDNSRLGSIGILHPAAASGFALPDGIIVVELNDIDTVIRACSSIRRFTSLPRYPFVERDSALIVNDSVTVGNIREEIDAVQSDIVEQVELFDIYTGKPIPRGKKSLAFSIRYRSHDRTLTDAEVDEMHGGIIGRLMKNLQAELR